MTHRYEGLNLVVCDAESGWVVHSDGEQDVQPLEEGLNIDQLAHGLLEAHWKDDANLADPDTLKALADRDGYDGARLLDTAASDAVKATYDANTEEAISRSVFGSPTYFVDGDMFYGQDRLEMVTRALVKAYE